MDIKKHWESAMSKPMDRRQFLGRTGAAMLTIVGASAVIKSLGKFSGDPGTGNVADNSYASGPYGGSDQRKL